MTSLIAWYRCRKCGAIFMYDEDVTAYDPVNEELLHNPDKCGGILDQIDQPKRQPKKSKGE
jgi:hypothetical protein